MDRKLGRGLRPFRGGGAGSPSNTKSLGPRPSSIPSDILIHAAIWPQQIWAENLGGCAPLADGELGPRLTQCGQSRGLPACQVAYYLHFVFYCTHVRMSYVLNSYLLTYLLKFHLDPSNRLATMYQHHRPDRTDRQDTQTDRQRSDSIGRTVLQTVAQKRFALFCRTVVLSVSPVLSCPVCDVGVLWPNGRTDPDETWHASRPRSRPHCVRWGSSSSPLPSPQKGAQQPPTFEIYGRRLCLSPYNPWSMHVCCGQTAGWIKMPLGREVGLGPGRNVLDGDPPSSPS